MRPHLSDPVVRINLFTTGLDRSDTPEMRQTAEAYAKACRDFNALLSKFRELLEHGRSREALEHAAALQPPLAEQAETLKLAHPKIFLDAAADYGWELPPALELETLQQLAAVAEELPRLQPLLAQWRSAARSTDDDAKVVLLRQLIRADPNHAREWKENLLTVEQRYVARLLKQAEDPALSREALQKIAGELLSPQLCRPPEAKLLRPLLERLRTLQQQEREARAAALLSEIAAADGAADLPALAKALDAYDRLSGDPDFHAPPEAAGQLEAARRTLAERQAQTASKQAAANLTCELEDALERQLPAVEIERLFRKLQAQTEEIPAMLAERVRDYLETLQFRENRRHFRTLFIAAAAALLLIALGITGGLLYIRERAYIDTCRQFERQLAESDPAALIAAIDDLNRSDPRIAARSGIQALRAKAEQRLAEIAADAAEFDRIIAALEALDADALAGKEAGSTLQKAGTLVTAADQPRRERLEQLQRKRADELKKRADAAYAALLQCSTAWQQKLQLLLNDPDPVQAGQRLPDLDAELSELKKTAQKQPVDPAKRDALLSRLESQLKLAQSQLERRKERLALRKRLLKPLDFGEYLTALEKAALDPEYQPQYQQAIALTEFWRLLAALRLMPGSWETDAELDRLLTLLPYLQEEFRQDLTGLLPSGKTAGTALLAEYQKSVDAFQTAFTAPEYQVKMLKLIGPDHLPYRFYTNAPLTLDKSRRRIKGVEINILSAPGGSGRAVTFSVDRTRLYPVSDLEIDHFRLPPEYSLPDGVAVFPENLTEPAHLALNAAIVNSLRGAATPLEVLTALENAFRMLANSPDLEPVIRCRMTARLLEITRLTAPFAASEIQAAEERLPKDQPPFSNWCDPAIAQREPAAMQQYQEQFRQADPEGVLTRIRQRRELMIRLISRDLVPFGILQRTAKGGWRCHEFPVAGMPQEVWLIDPNDNSRMFKIVGKVQQGKLRLSKAAEPFFHEGMVLWTPLSEPDTLNLLNRMQEQESLRPFGCWLPDNFTSREESEEEAQP